MKTRGNEKIRSLGLYNKGAYGFFGDYSFQRPRYFEFGL